MGGICVYFDGNDIFNHLIDYIKVKSVDCLLTKYLLLNWSNIAQSISELVY